MRSIGPTRGTLRTFRWMVLPLLSSTLVLGSTTVHPDHDLTCHPPTRADLSDLIWHVDTVEGP